MGDGSGRSVGRPADLQNTSSAAEHAIKPRNGRRRESGRKIRRRDSSRRTRTRCCRRTNATWCLHHMEYLRRRADRFGPGRNLPTSAISKLDSSRSSARTGSNGSLVRPLSSPSLSLSSLAGSLPHVFPVPLRFVSPRHPQPPCSHLHPTPILPVFVTALRFQIPCLLCIAFLFLPCCLYIRSVGRGRDGTRLSLSDGLCSRIFSSRARPKQVFGRTQRTYSQGRPFAR